MTGSNKNIGIALIIIVGILLSHNIGFFKIFESQGVDIYDIDIESNYVIKYGFKEVPDEDSTDLNLLFDHGYGYIILEGPIEFSSAPSHVGRQMEDWNFLGDQLLNGTPLFSDYLINQAESDEFDPKHIDKLLGDLEDSKDLTCDAFAKGLDLGVEDFLDVVLVCGALPDDIFSTIKSSAGGPSEFSLNDLPDIDFGESDQRYKFSELDLVIYNRGSDLMIGFNEGIGELDKIPFEEDFEDYESHIIHRGALDPEETNELQVGYTVVSNNKAIVERSGNIFFSEFNKLFRSKVVISTSLILLIVLIIGGVLLLRRK